MSEIGLGFVSPAWIRDRVAGIRLTPKQAALLDAQRAAEDRETVRDYLFNTGFRRDLFGSLNPLSSADQNGRLRDTLINPPSASLEETTPSLTRTLLDEFIRYGNAPRRIGDLEECPALKPFGGLALLETLVLLIAAGHAHPSPANVAPLAEARSARLNDRLKIMARLDPGITQYASALIGAGVPFGPAGSG
jgi:hypothetical protein